MSLESSRLVIPSQPVPAPSLQDLLAPRAAALQKRAQTVERLQALADASDATCADLSATMSRLQQDRVNLRSGLADASRPVRLFSLSAAASAVGAGVALAAQGGPPLVALAVGLAAVAVACATRAVTTFREARPLLQKDATLDAQEQEAWGSLLEQQRAAKVARGMAEQEQRVVAAMETSGPASGDAPKVWAFCVGITHWKDSESNPDLFSDDRADIKVADVLRERGVPASQITNLKDGQATLGRIQERFSSMLSKTGPSDTLLVYFSGHGERWNRRHYLVPYDSTDSLRSNWSAASLVNSIESQFKGRRAIIIADCCFSGTLARQVMDGSRRVDYAVLASSRASHPRGPTAPPPAHGLSPVPCSTPWRAARRPTSTATASSPSPTPPTTQTIACSTAKIRTPAPS